MLERTLVVSMVTLVLAACGTDAAVPEALGTSDARPLAISFPRDVRVGPAMNMGDPFRLHVETNSGDASYRTTWTLASGTCLRVVPRTGEPVVIEGQPIVADYYHFGRKLGVTVGQAGMPQQLFGFGDPVSWQTVACPASAAPQP